jgi:hypothetical protein
MNDDEKAYLEEWKKKCAATRARKLHEASESMKKAREKALADALAVGPGYRRIKSGPHKGTVVWKGSEQQRLDDIAIARENYRKEAERRTAQMLIDRQEADAPRHAVEENDKSPQKETISLEFLLPVVFIFSVSIVSFLIAKMFAAFGMMGLAIFIDFICYQIKAKRSRYSKYLPFLWWFLMEKK